MRSSLQLALGLLAAGTAACGSATSPRADTVTAPGADTVRIPLPQMAGGARYRGFAGGLYPGGNTMPAVHLAEGTARARAVQPLDVQGRPSAQGRYVLLSIGMSNTTQEFCAAGTGLTCDAWTFVGQANADAAVNHSTLALVNGARGGQTAAAWVSATGAEYDRIRDTQLAPRGLSEQQVQVAWVKVANAQPRVSLPSESADASVLVRQMGEIVRALKQRYPNMRQVFFSSRIHAERATTALNPEPYAYESGFAVKWVVQAQIDEVQQGRVVDARAGALDYRTGAPWIGWGPYLWDPTWPAADFQSDGTHPSQSGEQKVGRLLLDFFKTSAVTRCWFVVGEACT